MTGSGPPLSDHSLSKLKTLKMSICKKCEKEFVINDKVFSKRVGGSKTNIVYYHQKCWDKMQL